MDPDYNRNLVEEMNRYYEARTPWHDQYMSYTSAARMLELHQPIVRSIEAQLRCDRALELACGTGNWTGILAQWATTVDAIDRSPSSLQLAMEKTRGLDTISYIQADVYDLGEDLQSYDLIFSADLISHVPYGLLPDFLRSMSERLAKGGSAVFIDMSSNEYFENEPSYFDSEGNRISDRSLPDGSVFRVVKNFPDEPTLRPIAERNFARFSLRSFPDLERWMIVLG